MYTNSVLSVDPPVTLHSICLFKLTLIILYSVCSLTPGIQCVKTFDFTHIKNLSLRTFVCIQLAACVIAQQSVFIYKMSKISR